ncbi:hypothetical protein KDA_66940 [Dictyobacter alpinus]|uniref:Uncharacterized protein n=1 Tax=Dictyobacter alpinus TaxID=2014873 RepID=A0A402BIP5_9CHLR|nr:hypothetical protein [Dictyobacter alpinus]GCE31210.1 hypothetical protein KDA_66940 [Dictyobacter alpinus]
MGPEHVREHIYKGTSGDIFSGCENDLESMEVAYKQAEMLASTLREEIDEQRQRVKKGKEKIEKDSKNQASPWLFFCHQAYNRLREKLFVEHQQK